MPPTSWSVHPRAGSVERVFPIVIAILGSAFVARDAAADGIFVWDNESIDVLEPEQKAAIFWADGVEDLVLTVKFEGAPAEFGWIVPLPGVPEMSPDDPELFDRLSMATQSRPQLQSSRLARVELKAFASSAQVVLHQTVGLYDATILRAEDGPALERWLLENGFSPPPDRFGVLQRYASRGWVFAALRIAADVDTAVAHSGLRSGTIHPIRFRFACKRPVFPLEISSLHSRESEVLIYVVAREPWVPPALSGVAWESGVWSRSERCPFLEMYFYENPHRDDSLFRGTHFVSKSRARIAPVSMKDVEFVPFDAAVALKSPRSEERLDAIGVLAQKPTDRAASLLAEALRISTDEDERIALLWGMGTIGRISDPKFVSWLAKSAVPRVRLQAFETLESCSSVNLSEIALTILETREKSERAPSPSAPSGRDPLRFVENALETAALETLGRRADPGVPGRLRTLARAWGGFEVWESLRDPDLSAVSKWRALSEADRRGAHAVAALAASGDREAEAAVEQAIVASAAGTRDDAMEQMLPGVRTFGGYPENSWIHGAFTDGLYIRWEWPAFSAATRLFDHHPAYRDVLYRRIAHSGRVPDVGAALLLSQLEELEPPDVAWAVRVWRDADVNVSADAHRATAAAYLLGRKGESDALLSLWKESFADTALADDLVFAMTMTQDSTLAGPLLEYVRARWEPEFCSTSYRDRLLRQLADESLPDAVAMEWTRPGDTFRSQAIGRHLTAIVKPEDGCALLIGDESLNVFHRLHWLALVWNNCAIFDGRRTPIIEATRRIRDTCRDADPLAFEVASTMLELQMKLDEIFRAQETERTNRAKGFPVVRRDSR